jgi:hypothetical protein
MMENCFEIIKKEAGEWLKMIENDRTWLNFRRFQRMAGEETRRDPAVGNVRQDDQLRAAIQFAQVDETSLQECRILPIQLRK